MRTIHIYIVFNSNHQAVYVGASERTERQINQRHKARFGQDHYAVFIDSANKTIVAGHLEEYWFWQCKSWGFSLENKLPFKRYSFNPKSAYKSIDWNNYYLTDYRLSSAAMEAVLLFEDLYTRIKNIISVKTDHTMRKILFGNDWNSKLTCYQCMLDIKNRTGLSQEEIYETRTYLIKDRPEQSALATAK
jgi:hypothetical protein